MLTILLLMTGTVMAEPIVVMAPEANPQDFFIYTQNNEVTKISHHQLRCQQPLKKELKTAQYHFLNSSLELAQKSFRKITDKKWDCDWTDQERKIIIYSFFRQAQISQNPNEQMALLTEAINLDDSILPDKSLFPPPLVKLYQQVQSNLKEETFPWPENSQKFSYVLRNGKYMNLSQSSLKTYRLRARYTFVSDAHLPETFLTTADQVRNVHLDIQPYISGSCDNHQVQHLAAKDIEIFFSRDCIVKGKRPQEALMAQNEVISPSTDLTTPLRKPEKNWLKRNYMWVGTAILGSLVLSYHLNQQSKDKPMVVPAQTYN